MPSQIVPSLLAALQSATFGYSADDALLLGAADPAQQQQTPVFALYPDSVRAGLSNDALVSSNGSWASHFVPTVNLFLALVVFLFLVEERCTAEVTAWIGGRCCPSVEHPKDGKTAHRATGGGGMGRIERLALTSATFSIMGSMLFFSNGVFDSFAAAAGRADMATQAAGSLIDIAARFSSCSILVIFLGLALACISLAPQPQPTLPPLLFLLAPILLISTVLSRFSLALHTAIARDLTPAHVALLVLEPAGLLALTGWMLVGNSATSRSRGRSLLSLDNKADEEHSFGLYGADEKRPPVLIVITQHD